MSERFGVVWDATFLEHNAGEGHPERAERLIAIREVLQERGLWLRMTTLPSREAEVHELERNHTPELVQKVLGSADKPRTRFDLDTQASAQTAKAARLSAGGAIDLARAVWRGDLARGFSLGRPPGHHAEYDRVMGFCYFNNIAVAARALLEEDGLERILIVDWDVHHGNGTQHAFDDDPRVTFVSLHQSHFYPGTGRIEEIGIRKGSGYTLNLALPPGMGNHDYRYCFQRVIAPLAEQLQPQMVLLSAGYDAHAQEFLGHMNLTADGFAGLAHDLCEVTDRVCEGKLVAVLEGGYDLEGLSTSVASTVQVMLGDEVPLAGDADKAGSVVRQVCKHLQNQVADRWRFDLSDTSS